MNNEVTTGIAEPENTTVEKKNITAEDFAVQRLGQPTPQPEEQEAPEVEEEVANEIATEEVEGVEESDESTEDETPEAETDEQVLSQIDLDDMSEVELRELADKLGSRAVARFGELTAKRKAAEEKLQQLESQLSAEQNNPLKPKQEITNNPFDSVGTLEDLQSKATDASNVIEWAEDIMFNADGYEADDVVTEVEGKEMTKADVRNALLQARKARDKFLPARLVEIQKVEQSNQMQEHLSAQAEAELPWMKGEDNDTRREYQAIMDDPRVEILMTSLPSDVKAQMPYLLAHAANSIYGRKEVKSVKSKVRLNPSNTSTPSAAGSDKPSNRANKSIKNLSTQFKQSGDKSDFITLRTLQLQNR
tara:strand:- start:73 stop:1161 length:1089 start_codon:yes stop_codon:yes gene_type:complete